MNLTRMLGLFALSLVLLLGCGPTTNSFMRMHDPQKVITPTAGSALIIFERDDATIAAKRSTSLWDISDQQNPKLLALLQPTMRAAYEVKPGEYTIMNIQEGSHRIMKATVAANNIYYVWLESRFLRPGVFFKPIKQGQKNPIEPKQINYNLDAAYEWANSNNTMESVRSHTEKALTMWSTMTNEERDEFTLKIEDGR